ncbi:hypothetical protein [Rhizobium miluonense]|uniref:Uncharacterized protein n=1 Tax=Rhizobium miluonense TaxID=411945 RepID=A0A1C3U3D1_9HYPH|nr:hypothetical protein [Rhizobium miluonense]SCB09966.1 hypothetical protein GA0061102_1001421 [Rhizobium miluonense]
MIVEPLSDEVIKESVDEVFLRLLRWRTSSYAISVTTENYATKGNDNRPYIVARKR